MNIRDIINDAYPSAKEKKPDGNNIVFVIEGLECRDSFVKDLAPEIPAMINLALANNCEMIDIISSIDEKYLKYAIDMAGEPALKSIVLCLLKRYEKFPNCNEIIQDQIVAPLENLFRQGLISKNSNWILELNKSSIKILRDLLLEEQSKDPLSHPIPIDRELELLNEELQGYVNPVSADNLIAYLLRNPQIDTVYGLLGKAHLEILSLIGVVTQTEETSIHGEISIGSANVKVHFFGGTHGEMVGAYEKLKQLAEKNGLRIPKQKLRNNVFGKIPLDSSKFNFFDNGITQSQEWELFFTVQKLLKEAEEFKDDLQEIFDLTQQFIYKLKGCKHFQPADVNYLNYLKNSLESAIEEELIRRAARNTSISSEEFLQSDINFSYPSDLESKIEKQYTEKNNIYSSSEVIQGNNNTSYNDSEDGRSPLRKKVCR